MPRRIRAEIGVEAVDACLIADSSTEVEGTISDVTRSAVSDENGSYREEFTLNGRTKLERTDVTEVFSTDSHTVYQFASGTKDGCICRTVEGFGCPISNLHARDGTLYVTFHASNTDVIKDIVTALRERYSAVHVRHLVRADDREANDFVLVNRSGLTRKQREVLETAYEMGYFEHPKRTNAGAVADELDIASSTFTEHLAAAHRKVIDELFRT